MQRLTYDLLHLFNATQTLAGVGEDVLLPTGELVVPVTYGSQMVAALLVDGHWSDADSGG